MAGFQELLRAANKLRQGSLDRRHALLIRSLGYDPEFFRPRDTSSKEPWGLDGRLGPLPA